MRAPLRLLTILLVLHGPNDPCRADTDRELYLQAFVNGVDQDLIVRVALRREEFILASDDLRQLGLREEVIPASADGLVALGSMEGVIAHYSPLEQRLDLEVPTALLAPQLLGNDPVDETPPSSATGLVFDYALHLQSDRTTLQQAATRQHAPAIRETSALSPLAEDSDYASAYEEKNKTAALSTELRLFSPRGLLVNRGYTTLDSGESSYVREDSFWTYSELDSMRTWVVGDFIGSSLTWTRSLRFGGAQLSRNFGVRPDLVTFALPALGGTALVPTTVDLYVNGNRQFSGDARPGPFLLTDPPPLTGAGNVAIVYRDELGRQVTTTQPLYVDTRLLESGFSDYNIDVGYPRRHYGTESSDYGSRPEASASLRYGVTDALTLEGHTELSDTLQNAGAGLLLRLGQLGVLSGAAARSRGAHVGTLTSVGYQYIAPIWSIDLYDRRTHSDYGDLGTLEGVPVPQRLTRGSASVWFTSTQALSLNYVDQRTSDLEASRVLSLSYSGNWFNGRVSTYLSVFRDQDNPDEEGGYLSVNISFGQGASAYSSASRNADERTLMFGASRPLDYDLGGFGWSLASERGNDDYRRGNAQLDYRHRYVDLTAMVTQTGGGEAGQEREQWSTSLDALGSLVFMHRSLFATRAIEDGFALVSTRGLPDVPVLRENRALGRTNKRGFLLVPDLPAYRASRIGIDLLDAPVDVSTSSDLQFANPRGFSGVVVEFPIERMRGATLVLVDADEQPLPPGLAVTLRDSGASGVTGYGGQVFFSSLEKINRVVVETEDGPCEAEVTFDETQVMQTLGPFVCKRADVP